MPSRTPRDPVSSPPRLLPRPPPWPPGAFTLTHAPPSRAWLSPCSRRPPIPPTAHCQDFALVPIDWSVLDYRHHPSKADRTQVGNSKTLDYKLLSALLISDRDGQPLAPLCEQLQTAEGLLSSRFDRPRPLGSCLDELT